MITKYTYRNKKTGKKVYSSTPIKNTDHVLITSYRDTKMKSAEIIKK